MQTEIEAKFLDVDVPEFVARLKKLGATRITQNRMQRRIIFDYPDGSLDKKSGWIRVRDEGDKTTLSYKQENDSSLHGTKEVCLVIDDFDAAINFLESIGLQAKSSQETKRESWKLEDVEIEIDTWPGIPTFVELEAPNEDSLLKAAKDLELDTTKALHGSVANVYQHYHDVSAEEVNNCPKIVFSEQPSFLRK